MYLNEIGKYEIKRHLGNGAFGDVYLAKDRALDALKAIKILAVTNPKQFMEKLEEARILHKCKHKHIVEINEADIYQIKGEPKVVVDMEYLPQGCLENLIENAEVSLHDSISYAIDCLFALEHAHNQGILHRDIKPGNIMLCDYGAKLSDFGLATMLGEDQAGSPKGYIPHLAPEYFMNKFTTELTDIFAMGITLFRACNQVSDWMNKINSLKNFRDTITKGKLISTIGYEPFVPQKIKRIINKACANNQEKRFQSAFDMRQALEKLQLRIDWRKVDSQTWVGYCKKMGKVYSASIIPGKRKQQVDIKKNDRRIANDCKSFMSGDEAVGYVHKYISETSID